MYVPSDNELSGDIVFFINYFARFKYVFHSKLILFNWFIFRWIDSLYAFYRSLISKWSNPLLEKQINRILSLSLLLLAAVVVVLWIQDSMISIFWLNTKSVLIMVGILVIFSFSKKRLWKLSLWENVNFKDGQYLLVMYYMLWAYCYISHRFSRLLSLFCFRLL